MPEPTTTTAGDGPRIADQLAPLLIDIDTLTPHPANPNHGDVDLIADSIDYHGLYKPVVIQKSTRYILAGNHTWRAARKRGATQIPAVVLDVDDDHAAHLLAADNGIRDRATYDHTALSALLESLTDLTATGFTSAAADDIAALAAPPSLDDVADTVGDYDPRHAWPTVKITCPPQLEQAWKAHLDTHSGDAARAFAALLGIDTCDLDCDP